MKRPSPSLRDSLKERIVLTPEEKRVLCFVLAAFLLGVTVKHYRETHHQTPPPARTATSPLSGATQKKERKKTSDATPPAKSNEKD